MPYADNNRNKKCYKEYYNKNKAREGRYEGGLHGKLSFCTLGESRADNLSTLRGRRWDQCIAKQR